MFDDARRLDEDASGHVIRLAAERVDGVFVAGTNGEFAQLTRAERSLLVRRALAEAGPERVVVHVGAADARAGLALAADALDAGAIRLAAISPRALSPRAVTSYFAELRAMASDVDVVAYCYPEIDGTDWDGRAIAQMGDVVDGFKVSGAAARRLDDFVATSLPVWSGDDADPVAVVEAGGHGVVSGCASAVPELFASLTRAPESREQVLRAVAVLGRSIAHIKYALSLRGIGRPHLRGDVPPLPMAHQREIGDVLNGLAGATSPS